MAQLQKGTTYITGDQVTAANLNALVDSGILTPGAVTDQTAKTVPLAADTILLHSAADTALRKTTMTQLFATPQPIGATTPSSVAATTGTFSSTLGVTGVATLGNGAILGTPASGTVTNLTGTASININGTVGATTASTGAFTTVGATGTISRTDSTTTTTDWLVYQTAWGAPSGNKNILWKDATSPLGRISVSYDGTNASMRFGSLYASGYQTADSMVLTTTGLAVTGALSATTGTFSSVVSLADGTNASPSLTFSSDPDTGIYRGGADDMRFAVAATRGASLAKSGSVYTFAVGSAGRSLLVQDGSGDTVVGGAAGSNLTDIWVNGARAGGFTSTGLNSTAIGAITASTGAFTTLSATGVITAVGNTTGGIKVNDASGNQGATIHFLGSSTAKNFQIGNQCQQNDTFTITPSTTNGGTTFTTPVATFTSTGLAVTGTLSCTTGAELATSGGGTFVKIGTSTAIGSGTGLLEITYNNAYYGQRVKSSNSGGGNVFQILKSTGVEVGLISHNDTVTVYGGTSDYRLKDITGPLIDSGTFIDALKPKVGTWKSNGDKFVGFLAHEFAEVSPSSVVGEKDAVDAEGNPKYQGMQASSAEVIANLVAELQSLRKRLAALEAK